MMRDENFFVCACGSPVDCSTDEIIRQHIKSCVSYNRTSRIANIFSQMDLDDIPTEDLKVINVELLSWNEEISRRIQARQVRTHPVEPINSGLKANTFTNDFMVDEGDNYDLYKCDICRRGFDFQKLFFVDACGHTFCRPCLAKHVQQCMKEKKTPFCTTCDKPIQVFESKDLLGDQAYEDLLVDSLDVGLTKCVKCSCQFMFEPGKVTGNVKDEYGKVLNSSHEQNYVQNRFKCPNCNTEQCRQCKAIPYHINKLCEEYKTYKEAKLCRYCEEPIKQANPNFPETCLNIECQDKLKRACVKKLPCSHYCCGYAGEKTCTPCLEEACVKGTGRSQTGNDYCVVCAERLFNAPCIQSKCGHAFHIDCITPIITKKWHRPRITFNFCNCPLCKSWLEFPFDSNLQRLMEDNLKLYKDIKWKASERLKYEGRIKDEKLVTKTSPYFNKPEDYAYAIYSYYQCFKCKKPYFGGLKSCEDLLQEDNQGGAFKVEELVCANCSDVGVTVQNCAKHGRDFIEFKCKFCCSVAQWFCWGSTHFCDPCHKKQCNNDYLSKKKPSELPQCKGKVNCPLKIDHPQNGTEYALGCSLCRNILNAAQNF